MGAGASAVPNVTFPSLNTSQGGDIVYINSSNSSDKLLSASSATPLSAQKKRPSLSKLLGRKSPTTSPSKSPVVPPLKISVQPPDDDKFEILEKKQPLPPLSVPNSPYRPPTAGIKRMNSLSGSSAMLSPSKRSHTFTSGLCNAESFMMPRPRTPEDLHNLVEETELVSSLRARIRQLEDETRLFSQS